jgi:hypothetical protein
MNAVHLIWIDRSHGKWILIHGWFLVLFELLEYVHLHFHLVGSGVLVFQSLRGVVFVYYTIFENLSKSFA